MQRKVMCLYNSTKFLSREKESYCPKFILGLTIGHQRNLSSRIEGHKAGNIVIVKGLKSCASVTAEENNSVFFEEFKPLEEVLPKVPIQICIITIVKEKICRGPEVGEVWNILLQPPENLCTIQQIGVCRPEVL